MSLTEILEKDPCQKCEATCTHERRRLSLTRELNRNGCAHHYMNREFPSLARLVRELKLPKGEPITSGLSRETAGLAGTAFDHRLRMQHDPNYDDRIVRHGRELLGTTMQVPEWLEEVDKGLEDPDMDIRCLHAAVCDTHFRSLRGYDAYHLIQSPKERKEILEDVRTLLEEADKKLNLENPKFGPTFYPGSSWLSGADGDLINEGCLIDIKAGKDVKQTEFIRQVLAYAMLDVADEHKLNSIGVYLARYGILWQVPFGVIEKHTGKTITELRESAPWAQGLKKRDHAAALSALRESLATEGSQPPRTVV